MWARARATLCGLLMCMRCCCFRRAPMRQETLASDVRVDRNGRRGKRGAHPLWVSRRRTSDFVGCAPPQARQRPSPAPTCGLVHPEPIPFCFFLVVAVVVVRGRRGSLHFHRRSSVVQWSCTRCFRNSACVSHQSMHVCWALPADCAGARAGGLDADACVHGLGGTSREVATRTFCIYAIAPSLRLECEHCFDFFVLHFTCSPSTLPPPTHAVLLPLPRAHAVRPCEPDGTSGAGHHPCTPITPPFPPPPPPPPPPEAKGIQQ